MRAVLVLLVLAIGCQPSVAPPGDSGAGGLDAGRDAGPPPVDAAEPDAPPTPEEDAGPATVSFAADVAPVIRSSCGGTGCHNVSNPYRFLTTSRTGCTSVTERRWVVPGDPDASYVVRKLEGTSGICGLRMPRLRTPLTAEEIGRIRTWIAEGARNN